MRKIIIHETTNQMLKMFIDIIVGFHGLYVTNGTLNEKAGHNMLQGHKKCGCGKNPEQSIQNHPPYVSSSES